MQSLMLHNRDRAGSRNDWITSAGPPTDVDEDAVLVRRCRRGDVQAFGALVARHESRVRALVARILGAGASADDVDDTTQDVFVQVWRALPRYRGDAKFATWLYRVATNIAIKQWQRAKKRRSTISEEELPEGAGAALADPSDGPSAQAEQRAQDRALRQAVDDLPEKQRTAILLHYYEDYSCEEAAQIIGCSTGTVWSRLHYGCRKLRTALPWMEQAP